MENKKPKRVMKNLPVEGKIQVKEIKNVDFNYTLKALLKTPPPQKNNTA